LAFVVGTESKSEALPDVVERLRVADTLKETTGGKLRVVESVEEFPLALSSIADPIDLDEGENIRLLRHTVRDAAIRADLKKERIDALENAAGEAANNSLVHASGGTAQVSWTVDGVVQIRVWDRGPGIAYRDLPRVVLENGYTTTGTLGQGLKIVLESVDRCWIKTGEMGTTLVLEQFRGHA
jgi:anti-sigma regulatory factor (Ser/Thr protein kinase)